MRTGWNAPEVPLIDLETDRFMGRPWSAAMLDSIERTHLRKRGMELRCHGGPLVADCVTIRYDPGRNFRTGDRGVRFVT